MQPPVRRTTSRHPREQRKALYRAPVHVRRRRMTLPLSKELRARYRRRRLPVRKGDTVRVLGGSFVGREERVARVVTRDYSLVLDNITLEKADKKLKQLPIRTGHLVLTKLNLSDPWRRRLLQATEEEAGGEENAPEEDEGEEERTSKAESEVAGDEDDEDEGPSTASDEDEEKGSSSRRKEG